MSAKTAKEKRIQIASENLLKWATEHYGGLWSGYTAICAETNQEPNHDGLLEYICKLALADGVKLG